MEISKWLIFFKGMISLHVELWEHKLLILFFFLVLPEPKLLCLSLFRQYMELSILSDSTGTNIKINKVEYYWLFHSYSKF